MMSAARHGWSLRAAAALALLVATALAPRAAVACTLDNRPSMTVDGIPVVRNPVAPTGVGLWAPFTIEKAFVSGAALQLLEIRANLKRTLSSATLAAPFRWSLGDGTTVFGHAVTHRYIRAGLYQVTVYAFDARGRSWFPFDRALLHITRMSPVVEGGYRSAASPTPPLASSMWGWGIGGVLLMTAIASALGPLSRRRRGTASHHGDAA